MGRPATFTPEQAVVRKLWRSMISRCTNPNSRDFPRYGGNGVTVSPMWSGENGFLLFFAHIGARPSSTHSLDRIDNARGYEPGNVRWATPEEQQNNKRNNHRVVYRGSLMTIAEAAAKAGAVVTRENARCRISNGWPVEEAVETPPLFRRDPTTMKVSEGRHTTRLKGAAE